MATFGGGDFERVFSDNVDAVARYVRRRTFTTEEADDVVADVFASAWKSRHKLPADPLPWLYRAAANHLKHAARSAQRRSRLVMKVGAHSGYPIADDPCDSVVAAIDASWVISRALDALSDGDREVILLSVWEDLGVEDLGRVLGCRAETARRRRDRALERLTIAVDALQPVGSELSGVGVPR